MILEIREFKGLFTNTDPEDLPAGAMQVLKNLEPRNGKLIKTASLISSNSLDTGVTNMTWTNFYQWQLLDDKTASTEAYLGYLLIGYDDDDETRVYTYNNTTHLWHDISTIIENTFPTAYQSLRKNPIIEWNNTIRLIPGNDSTKNDEVWIGYIDRDVMDEILTITAGFYSFENLIDPSDVLSFEYYGTFQRLISESDSNYYYKYSLVYDGIQEGLISNSIKAPYNSDYAEGIRLRLKIDANFNRRLTHINIYRSDNIETNYKLIHTLSLIRSTDDIESNTTGAYYGATRVYIPALETKTFDLLKTYELTINTGGDEEIVNFIPSPYGTGHIIFSCAALSNDHWDVQWSLTEDAILFASGTSGAYGGIYTYIIDDGIMSSFANGGVITLDNSGILTDLFIDDAVDYAVRCVGYSIPTLSNAPWRINNPYYGSFRIVQDTDYYIYFYDLFFTPLNDHPLAGEVSISTIGEFAQITNNRLKLANIVLDPSGEAEEHNDWFAYSEFDQPDIRPVSNVIPLNIGEITGMTELMRKDVIASKRGIVMVDSSDINPANWVITESLKSIGNIAKKGMISVFGNVYVVYYNGIYRLSPNNLAESDRTPTEMLRITEPIQDIFDTMTSTQKQGVVSYYDSFNSEIVFVFPLATPRTFAFNIIKNEWREVTSTILDTVPDFTAPALPGEYVIYESGDDTIYITCGAGEGAGEFKTGKINLSEEKYGVQVNGIGIKYDSEVELSVSIYINGSSTSTSLGTLAVTTGIEMQYLWIGARIKDIEIEIKEASASDDYWEIHKIILK